MANMLKKITLRISHVIRRMRSAFKSTVNGIRTLSELITQERVWRKIFKFGG